MSAPSVVGALPSSIWKRLWERLHGAERLTTQEEWEAANKRLADLETTLASVDAELSTMRQRRVESGNRDE